MLTMFSLLEYLPVEFVGTHVLGCLSVKDIAMLERACGRKESHQLFLQHIAHCQPVLLPPSKHQNRLALDWFVKRNCKVFSVTTHLSGDSPALDVQADYFDLHIYSNTTIESLEPLLECNKGCKVSSITIHRDQIKEVVEQLSACTKIVKQLTISYSYNCMDWLTVDILSRWKLTKIEFDCSTITTPLVCLIGQTCSELTSIKLYRCNNDDSTVSAIAQHCPKLETLELFSDNITWTSLVTLSERGLPLEDLYISYIPNIHTADIARRCSHALSRIHYLHTTGLHMYGQDASILFSFMTGLTKVILSYYCHVFIPLLTQYCTKLTELSVRIYYSVEDILSLCRTNPLLQLLFCDYRFGFTDTILIELIYACPHLHTLRLPYATDITDTGILALSEHCPQLQCLHINKCHKVKEATVLQLLQRSHKLTRLVVSSSSLSEETWTQLDRNTQKRVSRC